MKCDRKADGYECADASRRLEYVKSKQRAKAEEGSFDASELMREWSERRADFRQRLLGKVFWRLLNSYGRAQTESVRDLCTQATAVKQPLAERKS